jgi:hypothetical protein
VRADTDFHGHHAPRLPAKELQHPCAPQPLADHDPPCCIGPVDLKYVLVRILPDQLTLLVDASAVGPFFPPPAD